jgi:3-oxoacyl-[acyl-carrier protein] reductase
VAGFVLDLTEAAAPARAVAEARARFGEPPTLFVSSTGGPPPGAFDELDEQAWERAADLVLWGFIRSVRALLPGMRAARHGRIVAVTSIAAMEPIVGLTTSSTLRAGLHGFVNALSRQVGRDGITVNALVPGYTRTARLEELADRLAAGRGTDRATELAGFVAETPLGRLVEPTELGAAAAFLCSAQAAAVSGQALSVDGGRLLRI